jgi:hypothetical protein
MFPGSFLFSGIASAPFAESQEGGSRRGSIRRLMTGAALAPRPSRGFPGMIRALRCLRRCRATIAVLALASLPYGSGRCVPERSIAPSSADTSHCHDGGAPTDHGAQERDSPGACCCKSTGKYASPPPQPAGPSLQQLTLSWIDAVGPQRASGPHRTPSLAHDPPAYLRYARFVV